jgi:hypothetical protein
MADINGIPYVEATDLVSAYPGTSLALATELDTQLGSKPTRTVATTEPTSPVAGDLWFDSNDTPPTPYYYDGVAEEFVPFPSGAGDADFSDAATGTYTDDGIDYKYITYTASGTLTVTQEGMADLLVVGGGAGGAGSGSVISGGGAGGMRFGAFLLPVDTYTVTIGAGGGGGSFRSGNGVASSLGNILKSGGGSEAVANDSNTNFSSSANGGGGSGGGFRITDTGTSLGGGAGGTVYGSVATDGISSSITGGAVTYASARTTTGAGAANTGQGGLGNNGGGSGVVIVRVRTN